MIGFVQGFLPLLGRILLSAIFLMSAIHKLTHWSATEAQMQSEADDAKKAAFEVACRENVGPGKG